MGKTQDQSVAMTPLWRMALHQPHVDADNLAQAIDGQLVSGDLDYRTRLLIRRGAEALRRVWGPRQYEKWIDESSRRQVLASILDEQFDEAGFSLLAERVVMSTKPQTVLQFLRELSTLVHEPTRLVIGGSIALILRGLLVRHTEDIDIVDEVPAPIRALGKPLRDLVEQYRLAVTHFQSHYLPARWDTRLARFDKFRKLEVVLVDTYDIFVGKLFSARLKDRDDLRALIGALDKDLIVRRLADTTSMLKSDHLRERATKNWYILFGEDLPAFADDEEQAH